MLKRCFYSQPSSPCPQHQRPPGGTATTPSFRLAMASIPLPCSPLLDGASSSSVFSVLRMRACCSNGRKTRPQPSLRHTRATTEQVRTEIARPFAAIVASLRSTCCETHMQLSFIKPPAALFHAAHATGPLTRTADGSESVCNAVGCNTNWRRENPDGTQSGNGASKPRVAGRRHNGAQNLARGGGSVSGLLHLCRACMKQGAIRPNLPAS